MISYEIYKILHIVSIITFFLCTGAQLFRPIPSRLLSILIGVTSFLVLVAGMGLLARIGVSHGSALPLWIYLKLAAWLILSAMIPIGVRRLGERRQKLFAPALVIAIVTVIIAVFKFQ
jgi:hypothetical protein